MCIRSQIQWASGQQALAPRASPITGLRQMRLSSQVPATQRLLPSAINCWELVGLPDIQMLIHEPIRHLQWLREAMHSYHHWSSHWERPSVEPHEPYILPAPFGATLMHRQLRGRPFAGQLRSELFLCTDHKTLRITERITRLLCPSSGPGPRHPPQQVRSIVASIRLSRAASLGGTPAGGTHCQPACW